MTPILARIWKLLPLNKYLQLKIMRLFQDQFLVAVTGVIFNENNQVLLFKHTYRKVPWNLPAGYMKAGEHPQEALEREIEEESGLVISIEERLNIRTDRDTARLEICYLGFYIGGEFQSSPEVSAYGFYALDDLPLLPKKELMVIHSAYEKYLVIRHNQRPSLSSALHRYFTP